MCGIDKGVAWSNATLRYLSCGHTGKVHSGFQVVTRSAHGKNRMVTGISQGTVPQWTSVRIWTCCSPDSHEVSEQVQAAVISRRTEVALRSLTSPTLFLSPTRPSASAQVLPRTDSTTIWLMN